VEQRRPVLKECFKCLREGDKQIACKPDRLARCSSHLLAILEDMEARDVKVTFLDNPELSTSNRTGKMVLTMLAAIAEFERALIKERQGEGLARAQAKGVKFGRPSKISDEIRLQVQTMKKAGEPMKAITEKTGLGRSTVYKVLQGVL
jgi:DNA invertase Pin-like site-specific DNA recombinase